MQIKVTNGAKNTFVAFRGGRGVSTAKNRKVRKVVSMFGGFPSINGTKTAERGVRSTLFRAMQEAIRRVNPHIFIAENVK